MILLFPKSHQYSLTLVTENATLHDHYFCWSEQSVRAAPGHCRRNGVSTSNSNFFSSFFSLQTRSLKKNLLVLLEGRMEDQTCTDPGARTPISSSRNPYHYSPNGWIMKSILHYPTIRRLFITAEPWNYLVYVFFKKSIKVTQSSIVADPQTHQMENQTTSTPTQDILAASVFYFPF